MVDICCGQSAGLYLLRNIVLVQDKFLVNGVRYVTSFLCSKCVIIILYYIILYYINLVELLA